jgi:hypothetical protein
VGCSSQPSAGPYTRTVVPSLVSSIGLPLQAAKACRHCVKVRPQHGRVDLGGGTDRADDGAEHLDRVARVALQAGHGAATFYSSKVTVAREMTMKLANEDRDEDRDGVSGFDSKAARAREFAAQAGLTAFALHASATGAVHAFHELTGEEWKPYKAPIAPSRTVSAQAAAAQIDALG